MFQLDENFLKDLGLEELPAEEKKAFLQHIYQELELRVGTRLAEGLDDKQLLEFESLINRDEDKVRAWLESNVPGYEQQPDLQQLAANTRLDINDVSLLAEYSATKWLEINRPDYRSVVAQVLEEIKAEIISNRQNILDK